MSMNGGASSSTRPVPPPSFDEEGYQIIREDRTRGGERGVNGQRPVPQIRVEAPNFVVSTVNPYAGTRSPVNMIKVKVDGPALDEHVQQPFVRFIETCSEDAGTRIHTAEVKRRSWEVMLSAVLRIMMYGVQDYSFGVLKGATSGFCPSEMKLLYPTDFGLEEPVQDTPITGFAPFFENEAQTELRKRAKKLTKSTELPSEINPCTTMMEKEIYEKFLGFCTLAPKLSPKFLPHTGEQYGARCYDDISTIVDGQSETQVAVNKLRILSSNTQDPLFVEEIKMLIEALLRERDLKESGDFYTRTLDVAFRQFFHRRATFILFSICCSDGFDFCQTVQFPKLHTFAMATPEQHFRDVFGLKTLPLAKVQSRGIVPRGDFKFVEVLQPLVNAELKLFQEEAKTWDLLDSHLELIDEKLATLRPQRREQRQEEEEDTTDSDSEKEETPTTVPDFSVQRQNGGIPASQIAKTFEGILDVHGKEHWKVTPIGDPMGTDRSTGETTLQLYFTSTNGEVAKNAISLQFMRRTRNGSAARLMPDIDEYWALAKMIGALGSNGSRVHLAGFSRGAAIIFRLLAGPLLRGCMIGHVRLCAPYWVISTKGSGTYLRCLDKAEIKKADECFEFAMPREKDLTCDVMSMKTFTGSGCDWFDDASCMAAVLFKSGYSDDRMNVLESRTTKHDALMAWAMPRLIEDNKEIVKNLMSELPQVRDIEFRKLIPLKNVGNMSTLKRTVEEEVEKVPKSSYGPSTVTLGDFCPKLEQERRRKKMKSDAKRPKPMQTVPEEDVNMVENADDAEWREELEKVKAGLLEIRKEFAERAEVERVEKEQVTRYSFPGMIPAEVALLNTSEEKMHHRNLGKALWSNRPRDTVETVPEFQKRAQRLMERTVLDWRKDKPQEYYRVAAALMADFCAFCQLMLQDALRSLKAASVAHIGIERQWAMLGYETPNILKSSEGGVYVHLFIRPGTSDVMKLSDYFRASDQSNLQVALAIARSGLRVRVDKFWPVATKMRAQLYRHLRSKVPNPFGSPVLEENPFLKKKAPGQKQRDLRKAEERRQQNQRYQREENGGNRRRRDGGNRRDDERGDRRRDNNRGERVNPRANRDENWNGYEDYYGDYGEENWWGAGNGSDLGPTNRDRSATQTPGRITGKWNESANAGNPPYGYDDENLDQYEQQGMAEGGPYEDYWEENEGSNWRYEDWKNEQRRAMREFKAQKHVGDNVNKNGSSSSRNPPSGVNLVPRKKTPEELEKERVLEEKNKKSREDAREWSKSRKRDPSWGDRPAEGVQQTENLIATSLNLGEVHRTNSRGVVTVMDSSGGAVSNPPTPEMTTPTANDDRGLQGDDEENVTATEESRDDTLKSEEAGGVDSPAEMEVDPPAAAAAAPKHHSNPNAVGSCPNEKISMTGPTDIVFPMNQPRVETPDYSALPEHDWGDVCFRAENAVGNRGADTPMPDDADDVDFGDDDESQAKEVGATTPTGVDSQLSSNSAAGHAECSGEEAFGISRALYPNLSAAHEAITSGAASSLGTPKGAKGKMKTVKSLTIKEKSPSEAPSRGPVTKKVELRRRVDLEPNPHSSAYAKDGENKGSDGEMSLPSAESPRNARMDIDEHESPAKRKKLSKFQQDMYQVDERGDVDYRPKKISKNKAKKSVVKTAPSAYSQNIRQKLLKQIAEKKASKNASDDENAVQPETAREEQKGTEVGTENSKTVKNDAKIGRVGKIRKSPDTSGIVQNDKTQRFANRFFDKMPKMDVPMDRVPDFSESFLPELKIELGRTTDFMDKLLSEGVEIHYALSGRDIDREEIDAQVDRLMLSTQEDEVKEQQRFLTNGVIRRMNLEHFGAKPLPFLKMPKEIISEKSGVSASSSSQSENKSTTKSPVTNLGMGLAESLRVTALEDLNDSKPPSTFSVKEVTKKGKKNEVQKISEIEDRREALRREELAIEERRKELQKMMDDLEKKKRQT